MIVFFAIVFLTILSIFMPRFVIGLILLTLLPQYFGWCLAATIIGFMFDFLCYIIGT
jgi:hypothetical protein